MTQWRITSIVCRLIRLVFRLIKVTDFKKEKCHIGEEVVQDKQNGGDIKSFSRRRDVEVVIVSSSWIIKNGMDDVTGLTKWGNTSVRVKTR